MNSPTKASKYNVCINTWSHTVQELKLHLASIHYVSYVSGIPFARTSRTKIGVIYKNTIFAFSLASLATQVNANIREDKMRKLYQPYRFSTIATVPNQMSVLW